MSKVWHLVLGRVPPPYVVHTTVSKIYTSMLSKSLSYQQVHLIPVVCHDCLTYFGFTLVSLLPRYGSRARNVEASELSIGFSFEYMLPNYISSTRGMSWTRM